MSSTKDARGGGFAQLSRMTPFRSARGGSDAAGGPPQYMAAVGPSNDGYQQLQPEFAPGEPWLSTDYYKDALAQFNIYDPTFWIPTLSMKVSGIMFYPWLIITVLAAILTFYFLEINPEHKELVAMPLDAHIVMGGALSFLVVMRTDASYASACRTSHTPSSAAVTLDPTLDYQSALAPPCFGTARIAPALRRAEPSTAHSPHPVRLAG